MSRRGEGHEVVRKTPPVSQQPPRQVLSASVYDPAQLCCSGDLPRTERPQWGASRGAHLQPPPSGRTASPAVPEREKWQPGGHCGGTTARQGWGKRMMVGAGGGGRREAGSSTGPRGGLQEPGRAPAHRSWPRHIGAGPSEMGSCCPPGGPGLSVPFRQWERPQQRLLPWPGERGPMSPCKVGSHTCRVPASNPHAQGGPTQGLSPPTPGSMADPRLRLSVSLRLRWLRLKFQLLWGHLALCPTNGPSPKSQRLLRTQVSWARVGDREKPQPACGPQVRSDGSTSGSQPQGPLWRGPHQPQGPWPLPLPGPATWRA